jgi:ATP-binding cassette subfamily B protein
MLVFLRRAARSLRPAWLLVAVIVAGLLIEASFTAMVPLAFRSLIDRVIEPRDTRLLWPILGLLAGGMVVAVIAGLLRDYAYAHVVSGVLRDVRRDMFGHVLEHPPGTSPLGDDEVAARFSTDLASVEHALVAAIPWAVLPSLDAVISASLLFVIEWRLALVAMLVFPLSLAGPRFFAARATSAGYERKGQEARVLGAVHEGLASRAAITAFGLEQHVAERFASRLAQLVRSSTRTAFFGALVERSASIGILILHVVVLGAGTMMTLQGAITLGSLVSFQSLFLTLSWSISYVAQYAPNLVVASGAARRIEELFNLAPPVLDTPGAVELPPLSREIRFEHVTFSHDRSRPTLNGVSFEIHAGQFVVIVGGVGSGKSSVLKLLTRFRDPDGGRILVDGYDVRAVTQRSLRRQMAVVFQDAFLFDASIRDNIRLGRLDATDSEIEAAASLVGLHGIVRDLPLRYDTPIGALGQQLSGGQRQLIAIARAMVRDPAILILDEPTSALDANSAALVEMALGFLTRGRTVVAVTHRLASARRADRVIVMAEGRVDDEGTHEQLLARGGAYAALWSRREGPEVSV